MNAKESILTYIGGDGNISKSENISKNENFSENNNNSENESNGNKRKNEETDSESSFIEEGTTSMGTISQMPEFALNWVLMYVEEVYVSAGDTVEERDALFKLAEDCIEEAKAYYEDAILSAEDTLTEAKLSYESGENGRSVSDVTYTVVISIENENNRLSAGTSAAVTFLY